MSTQPLTITLWSSKGGSGTSVTAAVLALTLAQRIPTLLIDAAGGDQSAIFGVEPATVGFNDWMKSEDPTPQSLARLTQAVKPNLQLLPWGPSSSRGAAGEPGTQVQLRDAFPESAIVIDAGRNDALAANADQSLLVLRPCYLAAQRASTLDTKRDGIVFINEPGRVLRAKDVSQVLNTEVLANIDVDPALARLIDAGRITKRLPRSTREFEHLVDKLLKGEISHAA